jgi:hypothetical protein
LGTENNCIPIFLTWFGKDNKDSGFNSPAAASTEVE